MTTLLMIPSLRHPDTARDYHEVLRRFHATLRSVCAQTAGDFRVVVVANTRTGLEDLPGSVEVLVTNLFPPKVSAGEAERVEAGMRDKDLKLNVGLLYSKPRPARWIYFFDADDWVHRSLLEWIREEPETGGWYIPRGYLYREGSPFIVPYDRMHRVNGSTHIIPWHVVDLPDLPWDSPSDRLGDALDLGILKPWGRHRRLEAFCHQRGLTLKPLSQRAVVYVQGTGENLTDQTGAHYGRLFSKDLQQAFSVENVPFPRPGHIWEYGRELCQRGLRKLGRN